MKSSPAFLASALLALCVQGCMTAETLSHNDELAEHGTVYSGFRKDFRGVFGNEYGPDALILWPVCICDMPLSLAADTIMLPYTIPKAHSMQPYPIQPPASDSEFLPVPEPAHPYHGD